MLKEKIKSLAKDYAPEFINIRHHLHANPELSYKEFETSKFVQGKLKEFAIPFEIKATTGVVGVQNVMESCTPAVMMCTRLACWARQEY